MTPEVFAAVNQPSVYRKAECAWFCRKQDGRFDLSNTAGGMEVYWPMQKTKENFWRSSEQLFQASKYGSEVMCLPAMSPEADPCVRKRIRAQVSPLNAKATQKCAVKAGLVRPDWDDPEQEVRIKAMLWVLELKLYWNPFKFAAALRDTTELPIVEISRKDTFWGCKETPDGELRGSNVLGKLLMEVRSRLDSVKRGEFSFSEGFLLP